MKSKFLYQDVDVVYLADKGIVVRCFLCRNYDKVLMETGKFFDNIRVIKNGLVSGVDKMFKSSDSAFKHFTDRLNPLRKSVDSTSSFFAHRLAYASHASMIMLKFWCQERPSSVSKTK